MSMGHHIAPIFTGGMLGDRCSLGADPIHPSGVALGETCLCLTVSHVCGAVELACETNESVDQHTHHCSPMHVSIQ